VRCLRAGGDLDAAARRVAACVELFRSELGVEPTLALHDAATTPTDRRGMRGTRRAAVLAQLETGEAVISAGAVEAGLERLRRAVASARDGADNELLARALIALGGALVHGARGTDVEGAAALHEGTALAQAVGANGLAATGWREMSWVQFLRAEYDRAEDSLAYAAELAMTLGELAWIDLIRGSCRSDVGERAAAEELLGSAVERLRVDGPAQPLALALTMLARLHLRGDAVDEARKLLDEALRVVEARGLTAFRPWPESFRAEVDLELGDVDNAERRLEHAFAVGCQVGDPCWESIAMRGLGVVAATRGDTPRALELLADAPRLCRRLPDTYLWIEAYALDALCAVAIDNGAPSTRRWIEELEAVTARHGMRELLLRATVYRARLGEPGAFDAAKSLAGQLDDRAIEEPLVPTQQTVAAR
jgi:tetratricopeptide (TPR) repeat protein